MKILKLKIKLIYCSFFLILVSCNTEEIQQEDVNNNRVENNSLSDSNLNLKASKDNVYHIIRFNILNQKLASQFITKVKKIANKRNGKLLTTGQPIKCLERSCLNRNLVIEFPNANAGNTFFNDYKANLSKLAKKAAKKLNYSVAKESSSTANDNVGNNIYVLADFTIINQKKYDKDYVPTAISSIIKHKGNFLSVGPVNCLMGNCTKYLVLGAYNSKKAFFNFYNDKDYSAVIPVRKNASKGGSFMITK